MELRVDRQQLRRILEVIVGERSPFSSLGHLTAVEGFIEKELGSYGLSVESDYFSYRGKNFRNIIGRVGPQRSGSLIILGAHFDSVQGTPGADDNASGVAVLLEAARLLARARSRSEVLFCAFNLEELNMIGSGYFAKKLKSAGTKVDAMISLEMVGYTDSRTGSQKYPFGLKAFYPDRGNFIGVIGNWNSASLLRRFARQMRQVRGLPVETLSVPGNGGLIPAVRLSDHSPFWDAGYPALMVTDTSFFRNPNYHGSTDTLETLNLDFMARVCEGVLRAVLAL
ncbi:MAG TPA: M28 family peptidase [Candidatus Binatia bacterium]|nr:M28 family peptidase [Candidatus Binatia bacterium]